LAAISAALMAAVGDRLYAKGAKDAHLKVNLAKVPAKTDARQTGRFTYLFFKVPPPLVSARAGLEDVEEALDQTAALRPLLDACGFRAGEPANKKLGFLLVMVPNSVLRVSVGWQKFHFGGGGWLEGTREVFGASRFKFDTGDASFKLTVKQLKDVIASRLLNDPRDSSRFDGVYDLLLEDPSGRRRVLENASPLSAYGVDAFASLRVVGPVNAAVFFEDPSLPRGGVVVNLFLASPSVSAATLRLRALWRLRGAMGVKASANDEDFALFEQRKEEGLDAAVLTRVTVAARAGGGDGGASVIRRLLGEWVDVVEGVRERALKDDSVVCFGEEGFHKLRYVLRDVTEKEEEKVGEGRPKRVAWMDALSDGPPSRGPVAASIGGGGSSYGASIKFVPRTIVKYVTERASWDS
jgi:hypothetical protein